MKPLRGSVEIYLVGGAVRDAFLGLPVTERDWVVVGATPEDMLKLGFQPVGKDFPVFLHPKTHEEYALARTERKIGKGYKGFTFYAASDVSLIEDLKRRDLTINAIAQAANGEIIDPYGGQADLKNKILRHVSSAFKEDPVRILRVARFASRFSEFQIHPSTYELMQAMVNNGEINALVAERVWQEFCRALQMPRPERFLAVLAQCQALPILFPQIILNDKNLMALSQTVQTTEDPSIRFAALLHTLDEEAVKKLCERYRIPKEFADLARLTAVWWQTYSEINSATDPKTILSLLKSVDARRRPERFQQFITACNSATGKESVGKFLQACLKEILIIDITPLQLENLKGDEFSKALEKKQLQVIEDVSLKSCRQ